MCVSSFVFWIALSEIDPLAWTQLYAYAPCFDLLRKPQDIGWLPTMVVTPPPTPRWWLTGSAGCVS